MALDQWFQRQDAVIAANRAEVENEIQWLDSAIGLLTDLQIFVNTDPEAKAARLTLQSKDADKHLATTLTVNLLNDAMGGLVSATRLLLFGDLPDAFALIRSAFEACCYAEHLVYHPGKAQSYMELESLLSASRTSAALEVNLGPDLQKRGLDFGTISRELETRTGLPVRRPYARLCNLGSHPSPIRVGLRLSPPSGMVLAAVSKSTPQWSRTAWTRGCAKDLAAVAKYAVEMLFEHYPEWFSHNRELVDRCKAVTLGYELLGGAAPCPAPSP